MSTILQSGRGMEAVAVHVRTGLDGQGKPTFGTAVSVQARVVHESAAVIGADGSTIKSTATLWIDAAQPALPNEEDRVVLADGHGARVIERLDRLTLGGGLDHVRLRVRAEGS